ncbi:AAA family ATPase [bacterium]|nr:AAA family ATPase [candidate division CSSED10-310 bacterium]
MEIIKVTGRNIRSLYGDFSVDFIAAGLTGSGLFAITGPTGSGKSTVLDTITLALYGDCPRTTGSPRGALADGLAASDPRTCMSRGSVDALAEVVFRCRSNQYRAIWNVRRARKKTDGTIQSAQRMIIDETANRTIADSVRACNTVIESITGLTYQQFTRSILLAQGDFAAFLKADASDRGALLESITGLWIYRELSIAAHRKARDIDKEIEFLDRRIADLIVPDDEALQELKSKINAGKSVMADLAVQIEQIKQNIAWHRHRRDLMITVEQAGAILEQARSRLEASADRRKAVERAESSWELQADIAAYDGAEQSLADICCLLQTARSGLSEASAELESAHSAKTDSETEWNHLMQHMKDLDPDIMKARVLDSRLIELNNNHRELTARETEALTEFEQANEDADTIRREISKKRTLLKSVEHRLDDMKLVGPVADSWNRIELNLQDFCNIQEKMDQLVQEGLTLESESKDISDKVEKNQTLIKKENSKLAALDWDLNQIERQKQDMESARDAQALEVRLDRIRHTLVQLNECAVLTEKIDANAKSITEIENEKEETLIRSQSVTEEAEVWAEKIRTIETDVGAANDRLDNAGEQLRVRDIRDKLKTGNPCPVCGSLNHPYKVNSDTAAPLIADLRDDVNKLQGDLKHHVDRRTGMLTEISGLVSKVDMLNRRHAELTEENRRYVEEYRRVNEVIDALMIEMGLQLSEITAGTRIPSSIGDVKSRLEKERKEIETVRSELHDLRQRHDNVGKQRDIVRDKLDRYSAEEKHLSAALAAINGRCAVNDSRRQDLRTGEEQVLIRLNTDLSSWSAAWESELKADPIPVIERWSRMIQDYRDSIELADQIRGELGQLDRTLSEEGIRLSGLKEKWLWFRRSQETVKENLSAVEKERTGILGGRLLEDVLDEINKLKQTLEQSLKEAIDHQNALESKVTAASSNVKTLEGRQNRQEVVKTETRTRLDAGLERVGIAEEEARNWIEKGRNWLKSEHRELLDLANQSSRAETVLAERQRSLEDWDHREDRPVLREDELCMNLERLESLREGESERMERYTVELQQGLSARQTMERLRRDRESTIAAGGIWQTMRMLIGSHDGSRFSRFAQRLTLERLIGIANRHLRELAPRYRLFCPSPDNLDLAVRDRDQADEERQVSTLSGGESFLVSLALALALAKLSSRQALIGSLFIDEGFGALDPVSLDNALLALESLSGEGRTIGIISHVPAIRERFLKQIRVEPSGGGRSRLTVI